MATDAEAQLVNDFLGSAQILTSAVNDLMEQQLREVTGSKLTFSQLKLLKMVAITEAYTVSNVAAFLGVSNAAASRAVDRLVRRGLLRRTESADDRRAVELSLTPEGHELLSSYDAAASQMLEGIFGRFAPDELRRVGEFLDGISVRIVEEEQGLEEEVCFRCGIHFRDRCLLRQARQRSCFFHVHKRDHDDTGTAGLGS
ncbi:MAG: MarR family transcriptional regulator [Gemmatimonadales bacterium]|nr:MarR family transcriptional regulator [Gemmatimonadales bacterium]